MKKNYNTKEYRDSKRVTAFLPVAMKKRVLGHAKKNGLSTSKAIECMIQHFFMS